MSRSEVATTNNSRDGFIRDQALIYAIALIQSAPEARQDRGALCDMCAMVLGSNSLFTLTHIASVNLSFGLAVNLWPRDKSEYSEEQLVQKAMWQPAIEHAVKLNTVLAVYNGHQSSNDAQILAMVAHIKSGKQVGSTGELLEGEAA